MNTFLRNPTAAGFILDSTEFLGAAELLLNRRTGISLPVFFLFSRAIELSLKAFLLHSGLNGKKLSSKDFGHNLVALLQEANEQGLSQYVDLEQSEIGALDLLSQEYLSTRLGYRDTDAIYYLPQIELTETTARKLVSSIDNIVNAACEVSKG